MYSSMKNWFDYYRGDIRLHDSRQAGEIAQRHSVEASFSQSPIPKSNDKMKAVTSNNGFWINRGTNVVRQEGSRNQTGHKLYLQELQSNLTIQQVYSHPIHTYQSSAIPEVAYRQINGIVSNDTILRSINETESQANQKVIKEGEREAKNKASIEKPELDPEQVAIRVYRLMCQDMILERERGAFC